MYHPADLVLTPDHDLALVAPLAADAEAIETFNIWVFDPARNIGFNVHPRATGGAMACSVTVFLPDGRIARANPGAAASFDDPRRPSSEFVTLECIEPFKRWAVRIVVAPVFLTSDAGQAAGTVADETPTARISLDAVFTMVAPTWINGALLPESRQTMRDTMSFWMGNRLVAGFDPEAFRYDQLIEGEGVVTFDGQSLDFGGAGLRGHVRGVRRMPGMLGHCWAEGWSPDAKRGFGSTMFLRAGGGYAHSEAFLFEDGIMHPARVICTPHLVRDPASNETVFELACDALGLVRIIGQDLRAFWWQMPGWGVAGTLRYGCDPSAPVLMKQAVTRYTWENGDVGVGLNERSG